MKKEKYLNFIFDYLNKKNITISSTTNDFFKEADFLDNSKLKKINEKELLDITKKYLDDVIIEYNKRRNKLKRKKSSRFTKNDLEPKNKKKKFSGLPPFTKVNYE